MMRMTDENSPKIESSLTYICDKQMKPKIIGDMNNNTKKQLADAVSKIIFRNEFLYANRDDEENNPANSPFERLGYIRMEFRDGLQAEPVTFCFDNEGHLEFSWKNYGAFYDEYPVASYIVGLMQTIRMVEPELVKSVKVVRRSIAEQFITFDIEGE